MKWVAVKRKYHGEEAAAMVRWVVGVEGQTRGICECWDGEQAQAIADLMNANSFRDPLENKESGK